MRLYTSHYLTISLLSKIIWSLVWYALTVQNSFKNIINRQVNAQLAQLTMILSTLQSLMQFNFEPENIFNVRIVYWLIDF